MEKIEKLDYTNACTCNTKSEEKNLTNTTQHILYNQSTKKNTEDAKGVFMTETSSSTCTSDTPSTQHCSSVKYSDAPSNQYCSSVKHSDTLSNQHCSSVKHSDTPSYQPFTSVKHSDQPSYQPFNSVKYSDTPSHQPFILVKYSDTPSYQPFSSVKYSDTPSNQLSSSAKYNDQANINDPSVESPFKTIQIEKLSQEKQSNLNNLPESTDVGRIPVELPCKPEKPGDSDCCGSGCVPCVFDIYDQEVKIWEQECAQIKNKALFGDNCVSEDAVLSELEYRQFCICDIYEETANTNRYRFNLPFSKNLELKIGQHIIIRGRTSHDTITRQYTPVSDTTCTGYFELLIKVYKEGKMSKIINQWKIGDKIDIRGPFGTLEYVPGKYQYLLMLAAGTGIAPMSQVIQGVLNNEDDESFIQLIYACHTYQDILMKKELDEWSGYWNFSVYYVLSQEEDGKYRYGDKIFKGRIDMTLIQNQIGAKSVTKGKVLICGTRSFDENMIKHCQNIGFNDEQIFKF